jgi:hypothetical protein
MNVNRFIYPVVAFFNNHKENILPPVNVMKTDYLAKAASVAASQCTQSLLDKSSVNKDTKNEAVSLAGAVANWAVLMSGTKNPKVLTAAVVGIVASGKVIDKKMQDSKYKDMAKYLAGASIFVGAMKGLDKPLLSSYFRYDTGVRVQQNIKKSVSHFTKMRNYQEIVSQDDAKPNLCTR